MKYVILFTFVVAFAFLAQADAKAVVEPNLDRGAIVEAWKEKLMSAKKKLDSMIDKAEGALKDTFNEAQKKAEHLIEELKNKASEISDKVFDAAQQILDKMDAEINESIPRSIYKAHEIEGISECMIMKDIIHRAALHIIANTSACINDKINEAESYVKDIYVVVALAVDDIKEIKHEGDECLKDIDGIKEITAAIACVAKVTAKGSLVIGQAIPTVTIDVAKLITEISTLQAVLPICMSKNALSSLAEEAQGVIVSIKDCIQEKLEGSGSTESSEEEIWNEQMNQVDSNNVDEHHSEVMRPNFANESTNDEQKLVEIQE